MRKLLTAIFSLATISSALALGPHEIVVLVNEDSADSIAIANVFISLRSVPEQNVIKLKPYGSATNKPLTITREDFTSNIWDPVNKAIAERKIGDHILAWIYSTDFPTTIKNDPAVSITGLTFFRNTLMETQQIDKALYASPLFCGPVQPSEKTHRPQTFESSRRWLGAAMPLPAMMLGVTGKHGNTREDIISCLKNGKTSDGTAPTGTVYFVIDKDIRSEVRQWQYPDATVELKKLGINAITTSNFPAGKKDILGLLLGQAIVKPEQDTKFLPGSMAEHFTSFAGAFSTDDQTKLTAWIKAGATASDGTVSEPFAIWPKFPQAYFYVYYASGCTMLESYCQSIRCPYQTLLVGDPLASPWIKTATLDIPGISDKPVDDIIKLEPSVKAADPTVVFNQFMWLLDGVIIGYERILRFDTTTVSNGKHILRLVAYSTGSLRYQSFCEKELTIQQN